MPSKPSFPAETSFHDTFGLFQDQLRSRSFEIRGIAAAAQDVLDGVSWERVVDSNRENRIDDAKRKVVVAVLIGFGEVGEVEIGFGIGLQIF